MTTSLSPASAGRPPEVPGYTTGRLLGFGGSAEVWSAIEESSGERVALKIAEVADEDWARVRRECMVTRRIDHPHVVKLRDVVELELGVLVLVLDHAPGGSLAALVGTRGPLEPGEAVTVLSPLATALADLHARGLVHGDVSPANVLFAEDGRPLLSDLGVASMVGVDESSQRSGTPGYTDPAVVSGLPATPASDVFGLSAVGWFALTGRVPPPSHSRPPLVSLAPGSPADLAALLEAGLDPLPSERPEAVELAVGVFDAATATAVRLVPTDPGAAAAEVVTHRLRRDAAEPAAPHRRRDTRSGRPAALGRPARHRGRRVAAAALLAGLLVAAGGAYAAGIPDLLRGDAGQGSADASAGDDGSARTDASAIPGAATAAPAGETLQPPVTADVDADVLDALSDRDPLRAVPVLARLRATAFATGSAEPLEVANAPGSSAMESDRSVLLSLVNAGVLLEGLAFDVQEIAPARVDGDTAVVNVAVVTGEHRRVRSSDGSVVDVQPRGDAVRSQLTLVRVDGQWRVSEVG